MDKDYSSKTIMLIDYGNFFYIAERLARNFGRVLVYSPWESAFPVYNSFILGKGLANVERVDSIWKEYGKVDVFYFPDLFMGDFQDWLRSKGKAVFGAGSGEEMELYRDRMKYLQGDLGLPINKFQVLTGLDSLRETLQERKNVMVKTNIMRGHIETFKHESYDLTKPLLDELEHSLGVYKDDMTFIIEDVIESIVEIGYDGFVMDGLYPEKALFGIEIKDCAYIGTVVDFLKLPKQLLKIMRALSPTFKEYAYRGSYTNEVRIGIDREGYLIDQTCRNPSPPTALQLEIYDNFPDIVWNIAHGVMPEIRAKYKYGCEIIIKSDFAKTEPQAIYFPGQYNNFVKIKNHTVRKGVHYYIPQTAEMEEIGGVVGMGNTVDEAIKQATTIAKEVKGYCVSCNLQGLEEAKEEIAKLKAAGISVF
jgi:hypothetical protein